MILRFNFFKKILLLLLFSQTIFPCTVILVTKEASKTGATILAHTDDGSLEDDKRILFVPQAEHKPGSKREISYTAWGFPRYVGEERGPEYGSLKNFEKTPVYGSIDQVGHTYGYLDGNYAIANEKGVAIAETTCASKFFYEKSKKRLFEITELTRIALERAKSAKEAVKIIGSLAEEHGYFDWGEMLVIADKDEGWVFEISASPKGEKALWVAKKVPEGEVFVAANEFRIRMIGPNDPDLIYSNDLFQIAQEENWMENGRFDWLVSVSPGEYYHPYYSLRRVWRLQQKIAPSLNLPAWVENGYTTAYPFSLKPEKKLDVKDVAVLFRDYYQGTEFDLSQGLAAGPFGSPYRYKGPYFPQMNIPGKQNETPSFLGAWERPISVYFCNYSHIVEIRPDLPEPLATLIWIGLDQPLTSCYMPFYIGVGSMPESFYNFSPFNLNPKDGWRAFNFVANLSALKFSYMIEDISQNQHKLERKYFRKQKEIDRQAKKLYAEDPLKMKAFINGYCHENAKKTIEAWRKLADLLIEKYANGSINSATSTKEVGYPKKWLKEVGYAEGPIQYQKPAAQK